MSMTCYGHHEITEKTPVKYCRKCDVAACLPCAKKHFKNGVCSNCRSEK